MKRLKSIWIIVYVLISAPAFAEYVSPLKYKDLSCEEMKEEMSYLVMASLDALGDSVESMNKESLAGTLEHERNEKTSEQIEAEQTALEEAMKRKQCTE